MYLYHLWDYDEEYMKVFPNDEIATSWYLEKFGDLPDGGRMGFSRIEEVEGYKIIVEKVE